MEPRKKIGFLAGPALFALVWFSPLLPENPGAHKLLAVFLLIVTWWVTECIPIPVTALLVPILITVFRIAPAKAAFEPFADPIIMLFLGSFILARAMSVHGLDRKLAHAVLSRKIIGQRQSRILFTLGLTTLFLSMWISNTATAAMMYPITLGVLNLFKAERRESGTSDHGAVLLLTLAFSASIGGIGTPIGSPPNIIAIGMLEKLAGLRITFFQWMILAIMVMAPMYLVLFFYMKFNLRRAAGSDGSVDLSFLKAGSGEGRLTRAQKNVLAAFGVTVLLWTFPGFAALVWGNDSPVFVWFDSRFPESAAAILGAGLLFFLPVDAGRGEFTLDLKQVMKIDWGTLLLFGGGLSLGFQMFETGLADSIGRAFISLGGDSASPSVFILLSATLSVILTEVTSNTAAANMIIPIIIAIAQASSINPLQPVLASAVACSFAFMLPVATPPNAIVYGSGLIPLPRMIRYGFWMEIAGIIIIWIGIGLLAPLLGLL